MYLAGYAVECMLKALIFSSIPESRHGELLDVWRRERRGHDLEGLREEYLRSGGARFPREFVRQFSLVAGLWDVNLRYEPRRVPVKELFTFIDAARDIVELVERRL